MNGLDAEARRAGFESQEEMFALVARVPLGTPEQAALLDAWKRLDGTKLALLRAFPELTEPPPS